MPKKIAGWLITTNGCITGFLEEEDGRGIQTSRIVARDDRIVRTKTGSLYELTMPHPYMEARKALREWYGADTVDQALDDTITGNLATLKLRELEDGDIETKPEG